MSRDLFFQHRFLKGHFEYLDVCCQIALHPHGFNSFNSLPALGVGGWVIYIFNNFFDFIYLFLERRERNIDNINGLSLSHPQLGTWPATQACALTGNRTNSLSVFRLAFNPLSHTSQGWQFRLDLGTQTWVSDISSAMVTKLLLF